MKPVTGSLQIKNGKYYALINLYNEDDKRKVKWVSLNVPAKGKKSLAQQRLHETLTEYNKKEVAEQVLKPKGKSTENKIAEMLVYDYMKMWLETYKINLQHCTYENYVRQIEGRVKDFFNERNLRVKDVTGDDLNDFYNSIILDGCKPNTAIHYHAMLHSAFKSAVKRGVISVNPCERADRPKKNQFMAGYYTVEELRELLELTEDDSLNMVIMLTAYYGLRRSEVLGIKWSAINFKDKRITINHKVTEETHDGQLQIVGHDSMKTKSSYRTLPLIPEVEQALIIEKKKQAIMKSLLKKSYCTDYEEYVCVDKMGKLIRPNYVSCHFAIILKNNNLKKIRFHDLRHTCASVMLANGVQMKQIQEWLGHSTFSTTADIYSHLDYKSKEGSADVMASLLK